MVQNSLNMRNIRMKCNVYNAHMFFILHPSLGSEGHIFPDDTGESARSSAPLRNSESRDRKSHRTPTADAIKKSV
jgi:hypothetical protein